MLSQVINKNIATQQEAKRKLRLADIETEEQIRMSQRRNDRLAKIADSENANMEGDLDGQVQTLDMSRRALALMVTIRVSRYRKHC